MKLPKYPLEQLILIKKKRLDESEKKLKEAKEHLDKERKKLIKLEEDLQKTFDHKQEKIRQLNEKMDEGTTSDKIEIAHNYLKIIEEDLKKKKKKVKDQEAQVQKAIQNVEVARKDMLKKQQDVEKLQLHKKDWEKTAKYEISQKEAIEQDEIGTAKFSSLKREKKIQEDRKNKKKN